MSPNMSDGAAEAEPPSEEGNGRFRVASMFGIHR
jgi:hypothetical protein